MSAGSSLPTGLLTSTDYFVRDTGNDTFKLALSSGGTAITISNTGSGTLTWTKTLLKVLNTDYSVAISSSNDATVTWLSGKRPVDGDKFFFLRTVPYTQSINLLNNSLIDAESLENQLDLIVNQTQQLNAKTDRDLRFHTNLITTDATASQASLNVTVVNRANKSLKFDALGSLSVTTVNVDDVEDYVLDAKSYATESGAVVNLHTNSTPSAQSGVYSAKEHAVGTPPDGSAKEWATTDTNAVAGGLYSAKQYAANASATLTSVNSVYDTFDDRFLGAHTTAQREVGSANIGLDHDGNALVTGALYFDTTLAIMKVWSGSAWSRMQPTSSDQTNINTLSASDVVTDMALLTASGVIDDMALLGATGVITDMAQLTATGVVADMALLAGNSASGNTVIEDMNTLATSDIIADLNTLATSDIVADLAAVTATGVIADLETVANNLDSGIIQDFADKYRIASSAPSSNNDDGDLYYNTGTNQLNVYDGSAWGAIGLTLANNSAVAMAIALG